MTCARTPCALEGGSTISWQLDLITPDGGAVKATRTHDAPTGVVGGFNWKRGRYGDCVTAQIRVHTPTLGLRNRDLVRLTVNGTPVFYGAVVECPHPRDPNFGDVALTGASDLLSRRIIGPETYRDMDVALIVRDLLQRYGHPAITYSEAHVPLTGKVLSVFNLPYRTLRQALDALGKTIDGTQGVPLGVLPDGTFFFGFDLAPALPIDASTLKGLRLLRVSGDDVVTTAHTIALNRPSGAAPVGSTIKLERGTDVTYPSYRPGTYVTRAVDATHSSIGAEAAALAPGGADIFTNPGTPPAGMTYSTTGLLNPAALNDNDASTAATNETSNLHRLIYTQARGIDADPMVGFRLVYSSNLAGTDVNGLAGLAYTFTLPDGLYGEARFNFFLPDTQGKRQEVAVVLPAPDEFLAATMTGPFTPTTPTPVEAEMSAFWTNPGAALPANALQIYSVQIIALDRQKLDTLTRKLLRPPAQEPTELTVDGLVGAVTAVALTGLPGGTLTGDVVEIEGRHDLNGLTRSVIKLEQPGASESARIIRLVAEDRAQDAQNDLRGYLERTP